MTTTTTRRGQGTGRALWRAALVGTFLQLAMVLAGHYAPAFKVVFAPGGMLISLLAGWLFARLSGTGRRAGALGGLAAGAVCAFVGILESFYLGDVPASLLALGTASSAATGALGGFLGAIRRSPTR